MNGRGRLAVGATVLAVFAGAFARRTHATPPAPSVDRIDYAKPDAYLDLPATLGDVARVRSIAAQLRQPTAEATLSSIGRWVRRNLKPDPKPATTWRPIEAMIKSATYGACGEHSVVFGALARACGIPTVWVKTVDVEWVLAFRRGDPSASKGASGRVFLEVHVDGAWRLLDSEAGLLHARYAPTARILPGERFAFDKGGDPFALVLPCRFEEWRQQTEAYFSTLDLAVIPWSQPRDLMHRFDVYVAGNDPQAGHAAGVAKALGFSVPRTFSGDWGRVLPLVRGATLVVTVSAGRPVFPPEHAAGWLPPDAAAFASRAAGGDREWIDRRLEDGTRVILVRADDEAGVVKALAEALR